MRTPLTGALPAATPSERLLLSRELLRLALRETVASAGQPAGQPGPWSGLKWLDGLNDLPGASAVIDALRIFWRNHPLHLVGNAVAGALRIAVLPMAQRNPLGLVVGALLLGGLFAWSRPWRWISAPALLAGLLPQLLATAMASLKPINWLDILASLAKRHSEQNPPGS